LYFPDSTTGVPVSEAVVPEAVVPEPGVPESRGHLNPGSPGLAFDRFGLGADLSDLVRHVWVPRWDLPDGEVRPQRVLTYPAFNAVITPEYATLFGPDSRVQVQELRGTSWAVGVLFRPAAAPLLTGTEAEKGGFFKRLFDSIRLFFRNLAF